MNKHEFKTVYNKIALSDEFRAEAREKLLAVFDDNIVSGADEQELHTAKEVKLSPQPKKSWKIAVGACAAAAAVGLGVWGVSAAVGRDMPTSDTSGANTQGSVSTSASTISSDENDPIDDINDNINNAIERRERIKRYETASPVTLYEGSLRNGDSEYDFSAYIYQIMSETEDAYRGNCAIEITENGEVVDRNMLLVGYTLGQNGTEFGKKCGNYEFFSVIELQSGSLLLSTREQGSVTEATLYTVKGDEIVQIERYFEDPADKPEHDSSVRSFNLSRSYTTENDDIIFDIGGEDVRVTIDFDELTLKCEDGIVFGEDSVEITNDFSEDYQATVDKNYGEVRVALNHYRKNTMPWDEETAFFIEGLPEVQFVWNPYEVKAVDTSGNEEVLFGGMPVWSVYLTDLNGDGLREICSDVSFGSGIIDDHVVAYDYAAKKLYALSDRGYHDYYLSYTGITPLMVYERDYYSGEPTGYCGELKLDGETLTFERSEDINTTEMNQYSLPVTIMTRSEHGGLTFPQDEEISAEVKFSLPASWECSASTASYAYAKVFEIGGVWRAYEGIDTDSYKTDWAHGETITVIEEKWGSDSDLYEYFIHTSTPIKYAPDGTYDVYKYVVESNGYYVTVSVMSDMGVEQETIDGVLESVEITAENDLDIQAYEVYELTGEVFHIEEMNGGTHAASNEDIRTVQLGFALPSDWEAEWSEYFSAKAYYDGERVFEFARPTHDDGPIEPEMFKTDFVDGDKVTVHEEKWGTEDDLFEYYIHRSVESKDADDGRFDEYIYIVNDGGFSIRLTFTADAGLAQEDIDIVLKSVRMTEMLRCLN